MVKLGRIMNTQSPNGFSSAVQGPWANYLRVKWRRLRRPYGRSDSWMPVKLYRGVVWLSATANGRDEAIQREVSTVAVYTRTVLHQVSTRVRSGSYSRTLTKATGTCRASERKFRISSID